MLAVALCLVLPAILSTGALQAQHDPGPRGGLPGAGGTFPTLNTNEQAFFNQAFSRFQEVQSVSGDILGEESGGLGPTKVTLVKPMAVTHQTESNQRVIELFFLHDHVHPNNLIATAPDGGGTVVFGFENGFTERSESRLSSA